MRHSFLFAAALMLWLPFSTQSQNENPNPQADKMYEKLGYFDAIDLYLAGELDVQAMQRVANSYRLNHDTRNAEKWYARLVELTDDPLNNLYYAQAMEGNGNYLSAREFYEKYARATGTRMGRLTAGYPAADRPDVEISNAGSINSARIDFCPAYYRNGLVFVSTREVPLAFTPAKDHWTGDAFAALYFSKWQPDGTLSAPEPFAAELNTRFHKGPLCFSKNSRQLFFTANEGRHKGEAKLAIYTAQNESGFWEKMKMVDLGSADANNAHPALSADGQQLVFSSDREGGYGGMDLYAARIRDGRWSVPINLGPEINTPGNEVFPFLHEDGTLFFSSDGRGGSGNLDVFAALKSGEYDWTAATNIGAPLNSPKDDFGFMLDANGMAGYLSSAREGGMGKDDIYRFSLAYPGALAEASPMKASVRIVEETTGQPLPGVEVTLLRASDDGVYRGVVDGRILNFFPSETPGEFEAKVSRADPFRAPAPKGQRAVTGPEGTLQLPVVNGAEYLLLAQKEGYRPLTRPLEAERKAGWTIALTRTNCLTLQGRVRSRPGEAAIPNATVSLVNMCTGEIVRVTSDADGNYEFSCLEPDCDFLVQGTKANFKMENVLVSTPGRKSGQAVPPVLQDLELLATLPAQLPADEKGGQEALSFDEKGFDETAPIAEGTASNSIGDIMEKGVLIELKNIYYDFDEFRLKDKGATKELNRLAEFLARRPEINVEIRSHTDSRGNATYNRDLSAKRAEGVAAYLASKGVSRDRMVALGIGEDEPVNQCPDGVECTEEEYQLNRRTEIKISRQ
jgi:outer membrane protein OmpA-like peptidoglycan-associated protein